jgi:hypothetical protein
MKFNAKITAIQVRLDWMVLACMQSSHPSRTMAKLIQAIPLISDRELQRRWATEKLRTRLIERW